MNRAFELIDELERSRGLPYDGYRELITLESEEARRYAAEKAVKARRAIYGNSVYLRGLIEITNLCRNDCLYCGIRRSNGSCDRYCLSDEQILSCCDAGDKLGFRTFVLQGGEGTVSADRLCALVGEIRRRHPLCAVTLSLGEMPRRDYEKLFDAGAERYLLRHETADKAHYESLHPSEMSFDERMRCLRDLKDIGFQVGCGFMVGSPGQTPDTLAKDLVFIEEFSPDMCGIGPFIPHKDTPFGNEAAGSVDMTLFLLSLIRLIKPNILLPATTALGTLEADGRERGILAGANVVMPNLSPVSVRKKYTLYDGKICLGEEAAECVGCLRRRMASIGYETVVSRGDIIKEQGRK